MLSETFAAAGSPLKKPKLDEEQTHRYFPQDDVADQTPNMEGPIDDLYNCYLKRFSEIESFELDYDVEAVPSGNGGLVPLDVDDKFNQDMVLKCAHFAISVHNCWIKSKSHLELVNIVKAVHNCSGMRSYYIILVAKDTESGLSDTYQTQVDYELHTGSMGFCYIRRKGHEAIRFPADLDDPGEYEMIKKCAEYALSEHNLDNVCRFFHASLSLVTVNNCIYYNLDTNVCQENFRFVKIVKAGSPSPRTITCRTHYITFEAKDTVSGQIDNFDAIVLYDCEEDYMILYFMEGEKKECVVSHCAQF